MKKYMLDDHCPKRLAFCPWTMEERNKHKHNNFRTVFVCLDCKVNTAKIGEYYSVFNEIWPISERGMLCIGCLEKRLGRKLTHKDFTDYPCNQESKEYEKIWIKSHRFQRRLMSP